MSKEKSSKEDKAKEIFDEVQDKAEVVFEEIKVSGETVVTKVKEIIREGNIRRIIIKNEEGKTLLEIPMTFGVVGALLAPSLAALGAVGALIANLRITVEKVNTNTDIVVAEKPEKKAKKKAKKAAKKKTAKKKDS
ncbi:MAG TPA: DUF4342 domain-containing protein [Trueperaceae bacterium]|nr:DUF4342 domain-containing protein [Trueperaceae bacterium]